MLSSTLEVQKDILIIFLLITTFVKLVLKYVLKGSNYWKIFKSQSEQDWDQGQYSYLKFKELTLKTKYVSLNFKELVL